MRAIVITIGFALWFAACAMPPRGDPRPFTGKAPVGSRVDLRGEFAFSSAGELSLTLAEPCIVDRKTGLRTETTIDTSKDCNRAQLDAIRVTAVTPWHREVRGVWTDARHLAFRLDWKESGLDPLADDAATMAARAWSISGTQWTPTPADAARILQLVADATETELALVRGGAAPSLEVTSFDVSGGTLRVGNEATLVVRIANRGSGTAYRVVATTRSSVASLHGLQLGFGMIEPGAEKVRRLRVTVPVSETAPDTMLVLVFGEGNGFAPRNVSRRVPLVASSTAPILAVRCSIADRGEARPDLDAGEGVVLHCVVDNTGKGAATVELETSVAGAAALRSAAQSIAAAGRGVFDVPVTIPRELAIDSAVEIAVTAHDRQFRRTARTSVVGVVRKPRLCSIGQLTRAQYRAKLTELRAAVAAGDLTQAQLDRYDAELVTCLK